jgi:hypothetical protein
MKLLSLIASVGLALADDRRDEEKLADAYHAAQRSLDREDAKRQDVLRKFERFCTGLGKQLSIKPTGGIGCVIRPAPPPPPTPPAPAPTTKPEAAK